MTVPLHRNLRLSSGNYLFHLTNSTLFQAFDLKLYLNVSKTYTWLYYKNQIITYSNTPKISDIHFFTSCHRLLSYFSWDWKVLLAVTGMFSPTVWKVTQMEFQGSLGRLGHSLIEFPLHIKFLLLLFFKILLEKISSFSTEEIAQPQDIKAKKLTLKNFQIP